MRCLLSCSSSIARSLYCSSFFLLLPCHWEYILECLVGNILFILLASTFVVYLFSRVARAGVFVWQAPVPLLWSVWCYSWSSLFITPLCSSSSCLTFLRSALIYCSFHPPSIWRVLLLYTLWKESKNVIFPFLISILYWHNNLSEDICVLSIQVSSKITYLKY